MFKSILGNLVYLLIFVTLSCAAVLSSIVLLPWFCYRSLRDHDFNFFPAIMAALGAFLIISPVYFIGFIAPIFVPAFAVSATFTTLSIGFITALCGAAAVSVRIMLYNMERAYLARLDNGQLFRQGRDRNELVNSLQAAHTPKIMLHEDELRLLEQLITADNVTEDVLLQQNVSLLKKLSERYISLKEKIETIEQALVADATFAGLDELCTACEISMPILLAKEYYVGTTWLTVPGMSYVTDRESFIQWGLQQRINPLNGESLFNPLMHTLDNIKYRARYRFYSLSAQYCWAPELNEHALQIRSLLTELTPQPIIVENAITALSCSSSFFHEPAKDNTVTTEAYLDNASENTFCASSQI